MHTLKGTFSIPDVTHLPPHQRGGEVIKFLRKQRLEKNQTEFACLLADEHVTREMVMKWENGEEQIPLGPYFKNFGDLGGRLQDVFYLEWGPDSEALFHIIEASNKAIAARKNVSVINNAHTGLGAQYANKAVPEWLLGVTGRNIG